jgi:hypothetical protein
MYSFPRVFSFHNERGDILLLHKKLIICTFFAISVCCVAAMPLARLFDVGLLQKHPGFSPGLLNMRFLVGKVALE